MPYFTIIIPTYNSGSTIYKSIESVLHQSFTDFEILVMDGVSSDNTISIAQSFNDERVKIFSEKDKGVYDAMNKGMGKSSGNWLYFLGSDDELNGEDVLDKVYTFVNERRELNVVYGSVKIIGDCSWAHHGDIYDGVFSTKKLLNKNICHQAIFYNMKLIQKVGKFNELFKVCADYDYNLRAWALQSFGYIDLIISKFKVGGLSSTESDPEFARLVLPKMIEYFKLSLFDKKINYTAFTHYEALALMQKKSQPLFYYFYRLLFKLRIWK